MAQARLLAGADDVLHPGVETMRGAEVGGLIVATRAKRGRRFSGEDHKVGMRMLTWEGARLTPADETSAAMAKRWTKSWKTQFG